MKISYLAYVFHDWHVNYFLFINIYILLRMALFL